MGCKNLLDRTYCATLLQSFESIVTRVVNIMSIWPMHCRTCLRTLFGDVEGEIT